MASGRAAARKPDQRQIKTGLGANSPAPQANPLRPPSQTSQTPKPKRPDPQAKTVTPHSQIGASAARGRGNVRRPRSSRFLSASGRSSPPRPHSPCLSRSASAKTRFTPDGRAMLGLPLPLPDPEPLVALRTSDHLVGRNLQIFLHLPLIPQPLGVLRRDLTLPVAEPK